MDSDRGLEKIFLSMGPLMFFATQVVENNRTGLGEDMNRGFEDFEPSTKQFSAMLSAYPPQPQP